MTMKRNIAKLLAESGLTLSCSEARRKIIEGAASFNGQTIRDMNLELQVSPGDVLKLGRKEQIVIQDCGDETFCCSTTQVAETMAAQEREQGREVSVNGNLVFVFG